MTRKILMTLLAFPSLLISLIMGTANAESKELVIGAPAPAFKLKDQHGDFHQLEQYNKKWLVLYFYPSDDTPQCTKEACHFRDDIAKLKKLNASVIGISLDDQKSHEDFSTKYNLQFPLLSDTDSTVSQAYGSLFSILGFKFSKRHSFIIDPDGKIAKIYRDVDADTHSQEIIKDLSQLINSK